MNLLVREGIRDMGRMGPGLAERHLPLMDHGSPHVQERGLRAVGRRVQRETVPGFLRFVHADPFLLLDFLDRFRKGKESWTGRAMPGLGPRKALSKKSHEGS